ncbi:MAG: type II secretion system protein [Candidatus Vogelbacteria bacterium]|nr:type II secretion system protein [Candidatus Vogelbacteria bacterium]
MSPRRQSGLTLIEMVVVLAIFIIMLGVVLANFPAFRDKTGLQLIAQEIATTIRQAQVYGIGTRSTGVSSFPAYGLYFDVVMATDKKSFILFADRDDNDIYTEGSMSCPSDSECVEKFSIRGAAEIADIQICNNSGCTEAATVAPVFSLLFIRFYPEVRFLEAVNGTELVGYSYARIVVRSTRDSSQQKWVEVWNTGQISVKNPT